MATVTVRVDQGALDREMRGRNGATGRVLAGFAGQVTKNIKGEMVRRAGGAYWQVNTTFDWSAMKITGTVKATRPHIIRPRKAGGVLVFPYKGRTVFTKKVNHPGSSPPINLVNDALASTHRQFSIIAANASTGA